MSAMFSFNNNWQRVSSDPLCMADDDENSYTRALHPNSTPDLEQQQQQHSELRLKCEEASRCISDRAPESGSEKIFVERITEDDSSTEGTYEVMNVQFPEQCSVQSRPSVVDSVCKSSYTSSKLKSTDIPDIITSEQSCATFDGSVSNRFSNDVSSEMSMTTEHANQAYCCHRFRYDESWSINSGTASAATEATISVFAPASTSLYYAASQYRSDGEDFGALIDVIKTDSTVSGLTTATSFATDTIAASLPDDHSVRVDSAKSRGLEELKEDVEEDDYIKEGEPPIIDVDEVVDVHYVEYVEEMARNDEAIDMLEQANKQGPNNDSMTDVGKMLEYERNEVATQDSSATQGILPGLHHREADIKTSFIKKLLPPQRFFSRKRKSGNSNDDSATTLILQTKNEFEMICPSSDADIAPTKASNDSKPKQITKEISMPHVRSTDSTKDVSVFTMRSLSSEPSEATGGVIAGLFSFGATPFQCNSTIEDLSLLLQEEVDGEGEDGRGSTGVYAHDSEYVDESFNVEMIEDDYMHSSHIKNVQSDQASTRAHKINILPRLVAQSDNSDDVKLKQDVVLPGDDAHKPHMSGNNDGAQKCKWNGMRMKLKRWRIVQSESGEE
ncbi:hypothetical protein ACHAXH_001546 [Discostella pseudostelligera]